MSLDYEDGRTAGEHMMDLMAKSGEMLPDGSELVYLGSTAVWKTADDKVVVVTLETECGS